MTTGGGSRPELTCVAEPDFPVAVLRVAGMLGFATAPVLRRAVLKLLTDQPELLLIDTAELDVADDITLTVLPMLVRQGAAVGTAVMVVAPSAPVRTRLAAMAMGRHVPVFPTRDEAVEAFVARPVAPRMSVWLAPEPAATTLGRALVDRTCRMWRVEHLVDTAALIMTELISNAIQHAGTPMRCSTTLRPRHLYVAVSDGSPDPPRRSAPAGAAGGGRGLLIVEAFAATWGSLPRADGKTVWAALPRRPVTVGSTS
ncbi:STAS domain-containing protein [Dactylosporangium sp. NPDC049525]|uniref:STAS domain-containing protein n=1 Tax=Dactylosporangium sp. NPDC049525 TaxID=3154730 RepID=UPI0034208F1A